MRRIFLPIFGFLCTVGVAGAASVGETVTPQNQIVMGKIVGREINRNVYLQLSERFQQGYPHKRLLIKGWKDSNFKASIETLLRSGQIQLIHAPSGSRICALNGAGQLKSLDKSWQQHQLANAFDPRLSDALRCQGTQVGIPLFYYFWGFFYKKSLFTELDIQVPETWPAFLEVVSTLDKAGKSPVLLGAKYHWPAISWLSYVNLRLHGIDYHRALAKGELSFNTQAFRDTLLLLKELVERNAFVDGFEIQTRDASLPLLYRNYAGMVLSGSFLLNQIPPEIRSDIGFFPFPVINPDVPRYEEVPVDGIFINKTMDSQGNLDAIVSFMADKHTQQWFSRELGYIPAHRQTSPSDDPLLQQGLDLLNSAEGLTQYFDRDAVSGLADTVPEIFTAFLVKPDIEGTIEKLEAVRLSLKQTD